MIASVKFRSDFKKQMLGGDGRSPERILAHYQLERVLADRLKNSERCDRSRLYGEIYFELLKSLPDHPQHKSAQEPQSNRVKQQINFLLPYIHKNSIFLEIGCGDAALSTTMASCVDMAFAMDVTNALIPASTPDNFRFVQTDGVHIPLADASIDIAYSNQLMEHLHPDDAIDQLKEIHRILRPGGKYICVTPSRITGPHDISKYFDYKATGLHLLEYDYRSLQKIFIEAGFRRVTPVVILKGRQIFIAYFLMNIVETWMSALPRFIRTRLVRLRVTQALMGVQMLGVR